MVILLRIIHSASFLFNVAKRIPTDLHGSSPGRSSGITAVLWRAEATLRAIGHSIWTSCISPCRELIRSHTVAMMWDGTADHFWCRSYYSTKPSTYPYAQYKSRKQAHARLKPWWCSWTGTQVHLKWLHFNSFSKRWSILCMWPSFVPVFHFSIELSWLVIKIWNKVNFCCPRAHFLRIFLSAPTGTKKQQ